MAIKKKAPNLQNYLIILLSLLAIALCLMWWLNPRKVVEVKTITKTVYVKQNATVTGATAISVSPSGAISATGTNLSVSSATVTQEVEKTVDKTVYEQSQWAINANYYFLTQEIELGVYKRFIGPVFAGASIGSKIDLKEFRASVGILVVF